MTDRLKQWLKDNLIQLVGVQQVVVNPAPGIVTRAYPADLRVVLWTGGIINIYALADILKPRALKAIIQHDTGQGVGSMFIVAPHLVPAPRTQFDLPEWLMALHALNNERVYTYPPDDREMALLQIHFERIDATERYEAIYGPQVKLERIHYGRVVVKPRAVKGFWLTAHFGPTPFWQHERQQFFMPPPRQQYSANGTAAADGQPAPRSPLEISYEILGIHMNASQEEVKTAFRRQVFSVHPDVSALPKMMAEEKFRALAEAYETIKVARGWT